MSITIPPPEVDLAPDQKFASLVKTIEEQRRIGQTNRVNISINNLSRNGELHDDDIRAGLNRLISVESAVQLVDFHHAGHERDDIVLEEEGVDAYEFGLAAEQSVFGLHHDFKPNDKITLHILPGFEILINKIRSSNTGRTTDTKTDPAQEQNDRQRLAPIKIKDVRLDEKNYLLEINNGEETMIFKSKKKGAGYLKETKLFNVLNHLWEYRWEIKDNKTIKKGDYASLQNLATGSVSESEGAVYKQIQRLNMRFKEKGLGIEIKGKNGKYRLIVNKA